MSASAFVTSNGPVLPQIPRHPPPTINIGQTPANSFSQMKPPTTTSSTPLSPSLPNHNSHFPLGHSFNGRNSSPQQQQPLPPLPSMGPPQNGSSSLMVGSVIGANSTSLNNSGGVPVPAPRGMNPPPTSITNTALPSIPGGPPPNNNNNNNKSSSGTTSTNPCQVTPPNAPNSVCSSSNSNNSGSGGRPRPQPIAGTPPPETNEKCDAKLVQQTCSLFGLDMVSSNDKTLIFNQSPLLILYLVHENSKIQLSYLCYRKDHHHFHPVVLTQ